MIDVDSRFVEICDTLSIGALIENMLLKETTQQLVGAIALGYAAETPTQRPSSNLLGTKNLKRRFQSNAGQEFLKIFIRWFC